MILSFHIPGPPVTWKRTNDFRGRHITSEGDRVYRTHVKMCARAALMRCPFPSSKRYALTLTVCPATRADSDLSNYLKQVEDALNGVVWDDDSQIDRLVVDRLWDGEPGVHVTVEVIADEKPKKVSPRSGQTKNSVHNGTKARKAKSNA